jgi:hypothetical protein
MGGNATIWVKVVEAADLSRPALLKQGVDRVAQRDPDICRPPMGRGMSAFPIEDETLRRIAEVPEETRRACNEARP